MFRNVGYAFVALLLAAVPAFWPLYLSKPLAGIDGYTHAHAALMLAWCGLLIAQPFLIRAGRPEAHRRTGALSYLVFPALVVASLLLAHQRFRAKDEATFVAEAHTLFLPLQGVVLMAASYALAIAYRKTPALHARLMICSALPILDPVFGRLLFFYGPPLANEFRYQMITFGATDAILVFGVLRGAPAVRGRGALAALAVAFVLVHALWLTAFPSDLWTGWARAFRALPLS